MTRAQNHNGFTLIEVLIVVVIMAVLAATIIPQFSSSTEDAQRSTLDFNLQSLRSQVEVYKVQHLGQYPTIQSNDLPQLTNATDTAGAFVGRVPDATHPNGPYIQGELPTNPFDNSRAVSAVATPGGTPAGPNATPGGWQYDVATGNVWPNHAGYTP